MLCKIQDEYIFDTGKERKCEMLCHDIEIQFNKKLDPFGSSKSTAAMTFKDRHYVSIIANMYKT